MVALLAMRSGLGSRCGAFLTTPRFGSPQTPPALALRAVGAALAIADLKVRALVVRPGARPLGVGLRVVVLGVGSASLAAHGVPIRGANWQRDERLHPVEKREELVDARRGSGRGVHRAGAQLPMARRRPSPSAWNRRRLRAPPAVTKALSAGRGSSGTTPRRRQAQREGGRWRALSVKLA